MKRGRYTKQDRALIREQFGQRDTELLARQLGHTPDSVRAEASKAFPRLKGTWSDADFDTLRSRAGRASIEDVATSMGRSAEDVKQKLAELARTANRRSPLSNAEVIDFRRRYGRATEEELRAAFGLSAAAVNALAATYRLAKDKAFLATLQVDTKMPRWNADEIEKLKKLYPTLSGLQVARELGRSVKSVVSKAHQLGLRKTPQRLARMGRENRVKE